MLKVWIPLSLIVTLGCQGSNSAPHSPREVPGYDNHQTPGASAHDLLSDDKFKTLKIEFQSVSGFEPTDEAKTNLLNFLKSRLNKPGGIAEIDDPSIPSPGGGPYTLEQVQQIEADQRFYFTSGTTMFVYLLFLDGASTNDSGSSQVLGYAHQNTSIAVFEKTIQNLSGGLLEPSTALVESTVFEHELGHILGLVNIGSDMQSSHQDSAHGAHCNVTSCLMYYAVDTSDIISNLVGGSVPELDPKCLADLKANDGK